MSKGIKYYIRHTMPLELAEFLRKNKCTEKYINNMYRQLISYCTQYMQYEVTKNNNFYTNLRKEIYRLYCKSQLTTILYGSFMWSKTPEGYRFWSEIFDKASIFQEQYR